MTTNEYQVPEMPCVKRIEKTQVTNSMGEMGDERLNHDVQSS